MSALAEDMMALQRNSNAAKDGVVTWEDREQSQLQNVTRLRKSWKQQPTLCDSRSARSSHFAQEGKRRMGTIKNELCEEELDKE